VIEKHLVGHINVVTCVFGELSVSKEGIKIKTKATAVKMARGEMVRYMAEHQIQDVQALKRFNRLNYTYSEQHSTENQYVFLK